MSKCSKCAWSEDECSKYKYCKDCPMATQPDGRCFCLKEENKNNEDCPYFISYTNEEINNEDNTEM